MSRRSYEQFCPLARSLDLVGERWTLLVVRELITGPKRYTDIRDGLPGVASDILTRRLRDLEAAGLVRRRELPPPAASTVYELTERGRDLEPALVGLARFGLGLLEEPPSDEDAPSAERLELLLRVLAEPAAMPAEAETVALDSGVHRLAFSFGPDGITVHSEGAEPPREPGATVIGDVPTIYELLLGRIDLAEATAEDRLRIEGDPGAVARMRVAFPAPAAVPTAA